MAPSPWGSPPRALPTALKVVPRTHRTSALARKPAKAYGKAYAPGDACDSSKRRPTRYAPRTGKRPACLFGYGT